MEPEALAQGGGDQALLRKQEKKRLKRQRRKQREKEEKAKAMQRRCAAQASKERGAQPSHAPMSPKSLTLEIQRAASGIHRQQRLVAEGARGAQAPVSGHACVVLNWAPSQCHQAEIKLTTGACPHFTPFAARSGHRSARPRGAAGGRHGGVCLGARGAAAPSPLHCSQHGVSSLPLP